MARSPKKKAKKDVKTRKTFINNESCNHRSFPYLDKQELMQGSYPAIFISSNNLRINSLPMVMLSLKMRKFVDRQFIK